MQSNKTDNDQKKKKKKRIPVDPHLLQYMMLENLFNFWHTLLSCLITKKVEHLLWYLQGLIYVFFMKWLFMSFCLFFYPAICLFSY